MARQKISMPTKEAVIIRYGVKMNGEPHAVECHYCGRVATATWHPPHTYPWRDGETRSRAWVVSRHDFDHVEPLSNGGANDASNIVLACPWCNVSKSNRTIPEWLELLADPNRTTLERRLDVLARAYSLLEAA